MSKPTLGIMVFYLNKQGRLDDRKFLISLQRSARRIPLNVCIFTPEDVDFSKRQVHSHYYHEASKTWRRRWSPLPRLIYDRCRYQPNKRFQLLRKFRATYPKLIYLNRPLKNKWAMHELFWDSPSLRPYMPETRLFSSITDITQMLERSPSVFIKPVNGTGGRGIFKIERSGKEAFQVEGRDLRRKIVRQAIYTRAQLNAKLRTWTAGRNVLVQQGLDLKLNNGRVHDFRMLIQKDGYGRWGVTGVAGRVGPRNSVTSNLHGGGRAVQARKLLRHWLQSDRQVHAILRTMEQMSFDIVQTIETKIGKLCELALDIAVDRRGQIWLLEINPKPAREVFARIGRKDIYATSIKRPLEYAIWKWEQHKLKR